MPRISRARRLATLSWLAAAAFVVAFTPRPVAASCLEIALADVPRTPSLVVLAGTVFSVAPRSVQMGVARWFVGDDPQVVVDIFGGLGSNEPGVVTSVDWNPSRGESYLVVAERTPEGLIVTKPCFQFLASTAKLDEATAAFGEAIDPAVVATEGPTPGATPPGQAPTGDSSGGLPQAWLPLLAILAVGTIASGIWLVRMRRSRA